MDVLSHFGELDELIQIIYQGFDRFIVLSSVSESSWTVRVGLKGPEGRWWRGSWFAPDITQFLGSKAGSQVLRNFAHNLAETFVKGELCIDGWTSDKDAKINLTLGPTSKKAVHVPLIEMSAEEAASYATTVFSAIALQAQSRKCRLNPPAFSAQAPVSGPPEVVSSGPATRVSPHAKKARVIAAEPTIRLQAEDETGVAQGKIKSLEAELARVKATKKGRSKSPSSEAEPKPTVSTRRPKGASLANPHKKARKYEAVEFADDD